MNSKGSPYQTIAMIVEQRYIDGWVSDARSTLEDAGYTVPLVVSDTERTFEISSKSPSWDGAIFHGPGLAGFGILAAAAAQGVITINTPRAIDLVRNKITVHSTLLRQGLPLPRTWFASDPLVFGTISRSHFPLIVKPFDGADAEGISLLTRPEDIALLPPSGRQHSLYLAQEFLTTDGWDLKLYGIGSQIWAVRKPSPVSFPRPGPSLKRSTSGAEIIEVTPQMLDIALICKRSFDLEIWGVDLAVTPKGLFIIEVNDSPQFSAVPQAGGFIGQHALSIFSNRYISYRLKFTREKFSSISNIQASLLEEDCLSRNPPYQASD